MENLERPIFKLVILGASSVGKTCILQRFYRDTFPDEHVETNAVNFVIKDIEEAGQKFKLYIWDTSDADCHRDIIDFHCRPSTGFILVYDITKEDTFKGMDARIKRLKELAQDKDPSFLIVGNKLDAEQREVTKEQGKQFAHENGAVFIETSAKTSAGVSDAFHMIVKNITFKIEQKMATWTLVEDNSTEKISTKIKPWFGWLSNEKGKKEMATPQNAHPSNTWFGWLTDREQNKLERWSYKKAYEMIGWMYPFSTRSSSTVSDRVPEELMQDPYTLKLYRLALEEGKELDRSIRVNIVGNYGQGKTTLLRRILNNEIKDVRSTDAIDVEQFICQRSREGKLTYRKFDDMNYSWLVKRLVAVARSTKEFLKNKASVFEKEEQRSEEKNDGEVMRKDDQDTKMTFVLSGENETHASRESPLESSFENSSNSLNGDEETYKMFDEIRSEGSDDDSLRSNSILSDEVKIQFAQELSRENSEESEDDTNVSIQYWDFGGQFIFYATHLIFLSRKAIYLLVLDLTSNFIEVAVDQDFPTESHERSMEYFVQFWISSIHSLVGSEDGMEPTVILVGTHKDKLKGDVNKKIETFFENVRKLFDGTKLLNHIYSKDFAVDNTIPDDEGIEALRETLFEIGKEKTKTVEIPAKWIQLERSLKEHMHTKIMPFDNVMRIDSNNEYPLGSVDQVRVFLQYHHSKGTFIYFDDELISNYIVLDPQYLIDAFKCIITSEQFCKKDPEIRGLFNKLKSVGRLEKVLIDKLWGRDPELMYMENKEILLAFLTKHHIISEAIIYDEDTQTSSGLGWYVVPSYLRTQCSINDFEDLLCKRVRSNLRFVMEFENSTIIPIIYQRLVAAIVGRWPIIQFREKPFMYKNLCGVRLENNHIGFAELRYETIELSVVNLLPTFTIENDCCDRLRRFVESVIAHEFRKLKCLNEVYGKLYVVRFRCNNEIHGVNGSKETIECTQEEKAEMIPCPDFESHSLDTAVVFKEWYMDHKTKLQVPKKHVTEKMLSQISKFIGHSWQTLGHELGLKQVQIEQIIEENPYSTSMKIFHMLSQWSRANAEFATLDVLVQAIQNCPTLNVDWDKILDIIDSLE